MTLPKFVVLAALCAMAAGCSTTPVGLTYNPAGATLVAPAAGAKVAVGTALDSRGFSDKWLGAIRGGFGQPVKTLETQGPVKDTVRAAFADGLKARGLAGDGPFLLAVDVRQFDCNQYVRREAHAKFHVGLVRKATGQTEYEHDVAADLVEGSLVSLDTGIFASVDDLRAVANKALQQAVDQALDDPGLRSRLASAAD